MAVETVTSDIFSGLPPGKYWATLDNGCVLLVKLDAAGNVAVPATTRLEDVKGRRFVSATLAGADIAPGA